MKLKHVLLIGKPSADLANVEYLLQLSGCKVISVRDIESAVDCMLKKSFLSRNLDLILLANGMLLMQFVETFSGVVRLRRKYPILVFDDMNFMPRIKLLMAEDLADYNVSFCSQGDMLDTIDRFFDFRLTDALNASV